MVESRNESDLRPQQVAVWSVKGHDFSRGLNPDGLRILAAPEEGGCLAEVQGPRSQVPCIAPVLT